MSENKYFWRNGEQTNGPTTLEELTAAVERGEVDAATNVSSDGETWRPGGTYSELSEALAEKAGKETANATASSGEGKREKGCGCGCAAAVLLVLAALAVHLAIKAIPPTESYMKCLYNMKCIALAVMFDGSVRRIERNIEPETLRALATAAGGEAVDVDAVAKKVAESP